MGAPRDAVVHHPARGESLSQVVALHQSPFQQQHAEPLAPRWQDEPASILATTTGEGTDDDLSATNKPKCAPPSLPPSPSTLAALHTAQMAAACLWTSPGIPLLPRPPACTQPAAQRLTIRQCHVGRSVTGGLAGGLAQKIGVNANIRKEGKLYSLHARITSNAWVNDPWHALFRAHEVRATPPPPHVSETMLPVRCHSWLVGLSSG